VSACAIVVSYRTGPALQDCLDSLARAAGLDEVILVDNGDAESESEVLDAFAAAHPHTRVIRGQGNVGFAAASNLAARRARSEALVFINPDVILAPDAIEKLAAALAAAPPPAIVGGDLRDAEGRPERGARRDRLTLWRGFVSFTGLSRFERVWPALRDFNRHRDPLPERAEPAGAVSGALMAVRRADFSAIGGFDEGYFLHVEDLDLCRRAEEAGWRVLFLPGPHGVHLRSTSAAAPGVVARHKAAGMARYFRKFARGPVERAAAELAGAFLQLHARVGGGR
jgi:N-acetylglucosaminyl-diphospho-decaprenol L-rhamnosyltransferase